MYNHFVFLETIDLCLTPLSLHLTMTSRRITEHLGQRFVLLYLIAEAYVTGVSDYFNLHQPVTEPSSWPGGARCSSSC